MQFAWRPGDPPRSWKNTAEPNSTCCVDTFARTSIPLPRIRVAMFFKLDLIDGFAGGGIFTDDGKVVSGTPLIMLEECAAARERLNRDRVKPLRCDFNLNFVDVNPDHTLTYARLSRIADTRLTGIVSLSQPVHLRKWPIKSYREFAAGSPGRVGRFFCLTRQVSPRSS